MYSKYSQESQVLISLISPAYKYGKHYSTISRLRLLENLRNIYSFGRSFSTLKRIIALLVAEKLIFRVMRNKEVSAGHFEYHSSMTFLTVKGWKFLKSLHALPYKYLQSIWEKVRGLRPGSKYPSEKITPQEHEEVKGAKEEPAAERWGDHYKQGLETIKGVLGGFDTPGKKKYLDEI